MIILLDLTFGAVRYRISTATVSVSSDAGDLLYESGLIVGDWESVFALSDDAPINDIPVQLEPGAVDVADILSRGIDVSTGRAELSALPTGASYEQRVKLISGMVSEIQYDDLAEPVSFSISAVDQSASNLVPPVTAILDYPATYIWGVNFSGDIPDANRGVVVPIVFGQPGAYQFTLVKFGAGSYGHQVDDGGATGTLAICCEPVHASTVYVSFDIAQEDRKFFAATVYNGQDLIRNVRHDYAWVDKPASLVTNDPAHPSTSYDEYQQRFLIAWTGGYGVYRPSIRQPVKTAGELIEYLLWKGGNVDRGRTAAAVPHLPVQVDGYIDERCDPVDWIVENICSILPVSIVSGPDGYYPIVARPYLDIQTSYPELSVARKEIYPAEPVVFEPPDKVVNEVTVRYRPDCASRKQTAMVLHSGDSNVQVSSLVSTSYMAQKSRAVFGVREYEVKTNVFDSPHSAHQVASWLIRRYAFPCRTTSYVVDPSVDMSRFDAGSGVRIVDGARAIDSLCVIESISLSLDGEYAISVRTVNA